MEQNFIIISRTFEVNRSINIDGTRAPAMFKEIRKKYTKVLEELLGKNGEINTLLLKNTNIIFTQNKVDLPGYLLLNLPPGSFVKYISRINVENLSDARQEHILEKQKEYDELLDQYNKLLKANYLITNGVTPQKLAQVVDGRELLATFQEVNTKNMRSMRGKLDNM